MSYILDALRRADAEREQGSVPGLHAQPVQPPSTETRPRAKAQQQPWTWVALGAVAGPLIVLAWFFAARPVTRIPAEVAPAPPPIAAAPAPVPRASPLEAPGPVAMPAPVPAPLGEARRTPAAPPQARPAEAPAPAAVGQAAEPPRIAAREQLPDVVRRELPELVAGGSIYSSNPANRSLIINGRLYREHDPLGPDLSLEEIRLKSAVLRFKGYLFEIRF